jgi:hypothetical protein
MRGHRNDDVVGRFARFDKRVERLGDNVGLFFVVTKDGKVRALPTVHQIKSLIEVEGWRPLGRLPQEGSALSARPGSYRGLASIPGIQRTALSWYSFLSTGRGRFRPSTLLPRYSKVSSVAK